MRVTTARAAVEFTAAMLRLRTGPTQARRMPDSTPAAPRTTPTGQLFLELMADPAPTGASRSEHAHARDPR